MALKVRSRKHLPIVAQRLREGATYETIATELKVEVSDVRAYHEILAAREVTTEQAVPMYETASRQFRWWNANKGH